MNTITNNRWITIIILLLLTANIVTLVLLWTHKNGNNNTLAGQPPPPAQVFEFVTKELQLDAAQQQAYKILREEHQEGQQPLQDNIRQAKDNFFELLRQPAAADTAMAALSSKVAAAEQQLEVFTFKHFQKLRAICNAAQQKKFDDIIKYVLRRMAPGRRPPGPPPPGMVPGAEGMPPPHEGPPPQ